MSFRDIIPYGKYKDDKRGFRHSIDKIIVDYFFDTSFDFSSFCSSFSSHSGFLFHGRKEEGYNSYFDKKPSSSSGWFQNGFWFQHVNVKYGLYSRKEEFIGPTKVISWKLNQVLRIEFNPNKVLFDDLFICLILEIKKYAKHGILIECDYAVDISCSTSSIISQSRKDKVIYNDSRYYGKRHTNGRLKIYNKKKEVFAKEKTWNTEDECTRCEVTNRGNEKLTFDSVFYCSAAVGLDGLSNNLKTITSLILLAESYGEDKEELLTRYVPDKRNRDKIIPVLFGEKDRIFDLITFLELLTEYCKLYDFTATFDDICVSRTGYTIGNEND